jgi:hypothetical protein
VLAERASVKRGNEVKRSLRCALDARGGRGAARTADSKFVVESGEGGSALGHVNAVPPLSSSDRVQVPRELVLQVASVFADFRDYVDIRFRRLMGILGQDQE